MCCVEKGYNDCMNKSRVTKFGESMPEKYKSARVKLNRVNSSFSRQSL